MKDRNKECTFDLKLICLSFQILFIYFDDAGSSLLHRLLFPVTSLDAEHKALVAHELQ